MCRFTTTPVQNLGMNSVQPGYTGQAHRASICDAALIALQESDEVRSRLVSSYPLSNPLSEAPCEPFVECRTPPAPAVGGRSLRASVSLVTVGEPVLGGAQDGCHGNSGAHAVPVFHACDCMWRTCLFPAVRANHTGCPWAPRSGRFYVPLATCVMTHALRHAESSSTFRPRKATAGSARTPTHHTHASSSRAASGHASARSTASAPSCVSAFTLSPSQPMSMTEHTCNMSGNGGPIARRGRTSSSDRGNASAPSSNAMSVGGELVVSEGTCALQDGSARVRAVAGGSPRNAREGAAAAATALTFFQG